MQKILVSACLLGCPVRYDGQSKPVHHEQLERLNARGWLVPFCPETAGGLPTPRPAAEIQEDGRVMTACGKDVTCSFVKGAELALETCQREHIHTAILKQSSPSCGSKLIYDGQFHQKKIHGQGLTAKLLQQHQIQVLSEDDLDQLFDLTSESTHR